MQNKGKDDGAERKHIKRERDKMKWCGDSQDSLQTQTHGHAIRKGSELSSATTLGRSCLPSFPRVLETTGEAIKRPLDPSALVLVLVATVPSSQEIKHSTAPRCCRTQDHLSQTRKIQ